MNTIQITLAILIGALVAFFAIESMTMIEISFVGFTVSAPLIVLILLLITAGFSLGKVVRLLPTRKVNIRERSVLPVEDDTRASGQTPNSTP